MLFRFQKRAMLECMKELEKTISNVYFFVTIQQILF